LIFDIISYSISDPNSSETKLTNNIITIVINSINTELAIHRLKKIIHIVEIIWRP
jgi:hypothetical protein